MITMERPDRNSTDRGVIVPDRKRAGTSAAGEPPGPPIVGAVTAFARSERHIRANGHVEFMRLQRLELQVFRGPEEQSR